MGVYLHIYMTYTQSHNRIVALTQGPGIQAPVVLLTAPGVGEKSFRLAGEGCKQILKGSEGYLFRKRSEESQKERERERVSRREQNKVREMVKTKEKDSHKEIDRKSKKESIRQKIERLRKKQIQKKRKTGIRKKKKFFS